MANILRNSTQRRPPTIDRVRHLLSYDPASGLFVWNVKRGSKASGQEAGLLNDAGYRVIYIDGHGFRAHQLAWLMTAGEWPSSDIDHANRDRSDNRAANLRLATRSENCANRLGKPVRMYSTHKGVSFDKACGKWVAQIRAHGRVRNLGRFDDELSAAAAYARAAQDEFGAFALV